MRNKEQIKWWAVVIWLLVWQVASMVLASDILLVSPIKVIARLSELIVTSKFWLAILFSFLRIVGGFVAALGLGILFAGLSKRFLRFRQLITPLIALIKSVPVASFIILALIWFSSKNLSVLISFMIVFPVVYTNVLGEIEEVDTKLIEMAKVYRLSNVRKLRYIYFPQVFPSIRTACSLGLGMCWKAGIAAEVIGMPLGSVGERLQQAKIFLNTPDLFAWTLVIVVISVVFEKVFLLLLSMLKNRLERI